MRLGKAVGKAEGVETGLARLPSSGRDGHTCGLSGPVTSVLTVGENTVLCKTSAYGATSAHAPEGAVPDTWRRKSSP